MDNLKTPNEKQSRIDKEHGGEVVEAISPADLDSFNDADCTHEKWVPDPTEELGTAFTCANPACNVVRIDGTL